METPREKELIRGEAPGEGSGLFEHSAANSSELTPAPHGGEILSALKLWIFCVLWNNATKHCFVVQNFLNIVESGVKAADLSASGDRGISAELEDPAPRGR